MSATTTAARPAAGQSARGSWREQLRTATHLDLLLLANALVITFTKLYWEPLGKLPLSHVLGAIFVIALLVRRIRDRDTHVPREVAIAMGFVVAFGITYGMGFFNIDTDAQRTQFYKGITTWALHASFLLAAAAHMARQGAWLLRLCVLTFLVGAFANAAYGVAQLVMLGTLGRNLDELVLTPLGFSVGGTRGIQLFGAGIYRINGLMRDTNHFGVMLAAPIVLSLVWFEGTRRVLVAGGLFAALVLSLSRSGGVGAIVGLGVLALPFRRRLLSPGVLLTGAGLVVALLVFTQLFPTLWESIVVSRLDPGSRGAQTHLQLYAVIPQMLEQHPFFGLGLNTFALHFIDISGRQEFGPHSYYIQLLSETGMVGFSVFVLFAIYLLTMLTRVGHPWGWAIAAAIVGTWAGNAFYLTTHIMYVDLLYAFALAAPAAVGHAVQSQLHADADARSLSPIDQQRSAVAT